MEQDEKDLLIRLDERVSNIWHVIHENDDSIAKQVEKIITYQQKQNGRIFKNTLAIVSLAAFLAGLGILEWSDIISIFGG